METEVALEPETWVDRHGDSLFRFAVLRIHDPEAAADLVQETFLEALRACDTFSGRSSVRTWLVAILKHKIVDRLRRLGREQRFRGGEVSEGETESMFDRHGRWRTPPLDWGRTRSASTNAANSGRSSGNACRGSPPTWPTRSSTGRSRA